MAATKIERCSAHTCPNTQIKAAIWFKLAWMAQAYLAQDVQLQCPRLAMCRCPSPAPCRGWKEGNEQKDGPMGIGEWSLFVRGWDGQRRHCPASLARLWRRRQVAGETQLGAAWRSRVTRHWFKESLVDHDFFPKPSADCVAFQRLWGTLIVKHAAELLINSCMG
jgi:hypothetical protein